MLFENQIEQTSLRFQRRQITRWTLFWSPQAISWKIVETKVLRLQRVNQRPRTQVPGLRKSLPVWVLLGQTTAKKSSDDSKRRNDWANRKFGPEGQRTHFRCCSWTIGVLAESGSASVFQMCTVLPVTNFGKSALLRLVSLLQPMRAVLFNVALLPNESQRPLGDHARDVGNSKSRIRHLKAFLPCLLA